MIAPGDIFSYHDMCREEGLSLQHGMNYRPRQRCSIFLMSRRKGAPYRDRVEEDGRILIYEGHDIARTRTAPNPKTVHQPMRLPSGRLTRNGLFFEAARRASSGESRAEPVRVYECIRPGIWTFNGTFRLLDAWTESDGTRDVFKFRLELADENDEQTYTSELSDLSHTKLIPSSVKLAVWKRDAGKCVKCGRADNLHFDHIVPYSKGGSSLVAANIQILCARHNLEKRDRIE